MKVRYKFRFYPTARQETHLAKTFGCVRFAYNWALRLRQESYYQSKKTITYNQSSADWTELKKRPEFAWLNEVSCVPTQQALRHLQSSFLNFFEKRGKYPKFKKKYGKQSAEYTSSAFIWDAANKNLRIAKIGRLNITWSWEFTSSPTMVTITKDRAGRYFVTLCLDEEVSPLPKTGKEVGIDFGVARLATLSDGERIANPKNLRKRERKLSKEQRVLSRRTKSSGRYNRQRLRVAKIHAKIADCRKDYLDKVTTDLVRRFDVIYIEDLNLRGMVKNHCLAKSISDASIGTAVRMLEYKALWYGKQVHKIDRFFPSSKTCSGCGAILESLDLSVREWVCSHCGETHDRDENAAKNILAVGRTVTARGGTVRRGRPKGQPRKSRRSVNQPKVVK